MKKLNVVFFGTPDFSVPTLEILHQHPLINIVKVITMPDRPSGRGQELKSPPVAEYAKTHKLPLLQTENINREEAELELLAKSSIDFFLVIAFAQFLGSKLLNIPKLGAFNIHTSLLPKYRGAAPIQYALLNGDTSTGVSIQRMVKQMDAGDLCLSHPMAIAPFENGGMLFTRLKFQAALSTADLIELIRTNSLSFTAQDETAISFAPTLNKEDGHLKFAQYTRREIFNRIRALDPWPSTYCFLNGTRLKVFEVENSDVKLNPGATEFGQKGLLVGTLDGSLRLLSVQLEGKKRCSDFELLNGLKNKTSSFTVE